jgi:hypothetical protein
MHRLVLPAAASDRNTFFLSTGVDFGRTPMPATCVKLSPHKSTWLVQRMLVDADNDWVAELDVDLAKSRSAGELVLRLKRIGSLC